MKTLPNTLYCYRKTPTFTQETIPKGLLHRHTTKAGSWGKICVLSGQLSYQILTEPGEDHTLSPDVPGIIEPQVPHQVQALGPVEFYVEFHQAPESR